MAIYTSQNYDNKSALQLQIEVSESNFAVDGSSSTVTANYYFISVNQPPNTFGGNITSDYGTAQSVACSIGSKSQTFNTNAFAIANSINKFGDRHYLGSLSTVVPRTSNGTANVKVSTSCTMTWRSGYPKRAVSATNPCIQLKHTVNYDANGGIGAPASQVKAYGHVLTLSSVQPSRSGYKFMGWSTSPTGAVQYSASGLYGADQDITLYAIWSLQNVEVTLTGTTITIPATFESGKNGFTYFYADPDYYVNIGYSYGMTGATSVTALPHYSVGIEADKEIVAATERQTLNTSSGNIRIPMNIIGRCIENCGSETTVNIGIQFVFTFGSDIIKTNKTVRCNLSNFKMFNVEPCQVFLSNDIVNFKFAVTYPSSFLNNDIDKNNAFPLICYDYKDALFCVSRDFVNKNTMLVTYSVQKSKLSDGMVDINHLGDVPIYNTSWNPLPSRSDYRGGFSMVYPTTNQNIIIKTNGECIADGFIESDYITGFFRGGCVVAKEFIEENVTTAKRTIRDSEYYYGKNAERYTEEKARLKAILNSRVGKAVIKKDAFIFSAIKEE